MPRFVRLSALGLVVLGITAVPGWSQDAPRPPQKPTRQPFAKPGAPARNERIRFYDVKHIKAELTIDAAKRTLAGVATHTLSPLHPRMSSLDLDCGSKLIVNKVTVGSAKTSCQFRQEGDSLRVTLDRPYAPGDEIVLAVDYKGSPTKGLYFIQPDPEARKTLSFWTQGESEETHHWLPCYDYPNDRATSEMIITTPKPLFVLSNGTLLETKSKGEMTTYHWKMEVPHSSYLISLAAADFNIFHDKLGNLPVDYYVAKRVDEATARRFMGKTPRMIEFFGAQIGQPYPYSKYAQVCVPDFVAGGMENISATTMTEYALHDEIAELEGDSDELVAHELAHQWFGDLLTCKDWAHIWLNEGFATYFAALYREHDRGEDEFRLEMANAFEGYKAGDRSVRRSIVENRYENAEQMFEGVTYSKGACVLHALRGVVGDQVWWKGIKRYVADNKLRNVETDDFRKAMEAASGQDLKWFFEQWTKKGGHPELKASWRYEPADKTVRVLVKQVQDLTLDTPLFRLPTTIEITEAPGKKTVVPIVIDGPVHEFVIPFPARPRLVEIDPYYWIPKELEFQKDPAERVFQLEHAACVLGRLEAAHALVEPAKNDDRLTEVLEQAWKREKSPSARVRMVELIADGDEEYRGALLDAARDREPRVRAAAADGLGRLSRDAVVESMLRAFASSTRETYSARRAALRALASWKVENLDALLDSTLKNPAGEYTLARTALELKLAHNDARAREIAALYSRYGQPAALRSAALQALERLAKDDLALQQAILPLVDDPDRNLRLQAWRIAGALGIKQALPALEAQLASESAGFLVGYRRSTLEGAIAALKKKSDAAAAKPKAEPTAAELESQAAELEKKARDLRAKLSALKSGPAAPATSNGAGH